LQVRLDNRRHSSAEPTILKTCFDLFVDECINDYALKDVARHLELQGLARLEKGLDGPVIQLRSRLL
jgi:hypothetical protein